MSFFQKYTTRVAKFLYSATTVIKKPIEERKVAILQDTAFLQSVKEIARYSLLDTDRLANLWEYCRLSNPEGAILEIGSYKGGGALHLSNAQPDRPIYIFDSFQGFENVDTRLDANFSMSQFKDTSIQEVMSLFVNKQRRFEIIDGFFPSSAAGKDIPRASFVHLDVDVYKATIESLLFLDDKMTDKSFIVLDDYNRSCEGVNNAVAEFLAHSKNWNVFPLFPSQGLLIHKSWFDR